MIIGAGKQMMKDHVPVILGNTDCEIISIVETNQKGLQVAAEFIGCPGFTRLEDALAFMKPDIAVVSVPHNQYWDILVPLAQNHIATLKEKPLGMSEKEGERIINLFSKNNTYLQICVQRRFSDLYDISKQLVERLGEVYSIYAEYNLDLLSLDKSALRWRSDKSISGGGATLDLGYHTIDLLTYLFGMPDKIYAQLNYNSLPGDYTIDDSMKAMCTYNEGKINANLVVTLIYRSRGEMVKVFGREGYVSVENGSVSLHDRHHNLIETHSFNSKDHEVKNQFNYFLSRVDKPVDFSKENILQDQLKNMKIIDAIYKSDSDNIIVRFV